MAGVLSVRCVCACALPPVCLIRINAFNPVMCLSFKAASLTSSRCDVIMKLSSLRTSLESQLESLSPAKAAAWPAVAGELVLPGPPFQSGLTRKDWICH